MARVSGETSKVGSGRDASESLEMNPDPGEAIVHCPIVLRPSVLPTRSARCLLQ